jgi:Phosphoadenosine phosphosulfate reductase family
MASVATRPIDRINTAPRYTESDAIRLNNMFRGRDTVEMLEALIADNMLGDAAIVSSFGAESAVLLHLIGSIDPSVPVIFLETGKHFPETLAYRDLLIETIGLTGVRNIMPDPEAIAKKDETGLRWSYDPDGCCEIRKVIPLKAALAPFDAQFTGRKAFQSSTLSRIGTRLALRPIWLTTPCPYTRLSPKAIHRLAARRARAKSRPGKMSALGVGRAGTRLNVASTPRSRTTLPMIRSFKGPS